jgi:hypothetical protein
MLIGETFPAASAAVFFDRTDWVGYSERGRYCTTFFDAMPPAAWLFLSFFLYFAFALVERKSEIQIETVVLCCRRLKGA